MLLGKIINLLLQTLQLCIHKPVCSISSTVSQYSRLLWRKTAYFFEVPSGASQQWVLYISWSLFSSESIKFLSFFWKLGENPPSHFFFFHVKNKYMDKIYLYKPISIFQCIAGEWLWHDKIGFAFLKQICLPKGEHFGKGWVKILEDPERTQRQ